jgi:hypothetical protein
MDIYEFLKSVDESNRACEMALCYAALILADFRELTPEGRRVMTDELMDLISREERGM